MLLAQGLLTHCGDESAAFRPLSAYRNADGCPLGRFVCCAPGLASGAPRRPRDAVPMPMCSAANIRRSTSTCSVTLSAMRGRGRRPAFAAAVAEARAGAALETSTSGWRRWPRGAAQLSVLPHRRHTYTPAPELGHAQSHIATRHLHTALIIAQLAASSTLTINAAAGHVHSIIELSSAASRGAYTASLVELKYCLQLAEHVDALT